jgi:hypothetical protein
MKGPPQAVFKQLDKRKTGMVTPMEFSEFVQKNVSQISALAKVDQQLTLTQPFKGQSSQGSP